MTNRSTQPQKSPSRPNHLVAHALLASLAAIVVVIGAAPASAAVPSSAAVPRTGGITAMPLVAAPAGAAPNNCDPDIGCGDPLPQAASCSVYPPQPSGGDSVSRGNNPEFGGAFSRISWSVRVTCFHGFGTRIVGMQAQLWDRTQGGPLYGGLVVGGSNDHTASMAVDLYDVDYYPAAQRAEQVLVIEAIAPGVGGWSYPPCVSPNPVFYAISCEVSGQNLRAVIGFNAFNTGVSKPACTRNFQWDWTDTVAAVGVHTMATPLASFEWCVDARGRAQDAKLLRFLGNSRYPNLIVDPNPPNINIVKSNNGTYVVSFAVNWRFNAQTKVGIGVLGKDLLGLDFGINESCQLSVSFILGNGYPSDTVTGTNPCKNWRPIMGQ